MTTKWATLQARRTATAHLDGRAELWRPAYTPDGRGGQTEVLARVATLPARLEPPSERAQVYADKMGQVASVVVVLPFDTRLRPGDELRVDGRRLRFVGDDAGGADAFVLRVVASEIA